MAPRAGLIVVLGVALGACEPERSACLPRAKRSRNSSDLSLSIMRNGTVVGTSVVVAAARLSC